MDSGLASCSQKTGWRIIYNPKNTALMCAVTPLGERDNLGEKKLNQQGEDGMQGSLWDSGSRGEPVFYNNEN